MRLRHVLAPTAFAAAAILASPAVPAAFAADHPTSGAREYNPGDYDSGLVHTYIDPPIGPGGSDTCHQAPVAHCSGGQPFILELPPDHQGFPSDDGDNGFGPFNVG